VKKHFIYITIILLLWAALPLSSQTTGTTVRSSVDSSTAYVGQPVRYSIKISGAKKTERPELENFKGFRIQESGESSSVRAYSQNGRTTKVVISEYSWLLYPEHTGNLLIPALSLTIDGKSVRTAEGTLNVIEPAPLEGYHLFLESEGADVFPGLPVRISLKWLFSSQVSQPNFTLPFLEQDNLDVKSLPAPSGQNNDIYQFTIGDEIVFATQSAQMYEGKQYASLTIEWDAYPRETGTIELDPVILSFKRGVGQDGWGNVDYENAVIPSNRLSLQVMPLPEDLKNAPAGLLISKDKLDVQIELDQQRAYPGDPLTLKMKLTNLSQPDMTDFKGFQNFPELQEQFRIDGASLITYEEEDSLIIKQTVRVIDAETVSFPALSFLYYNQATGKTEVSRSEALDLEIVPIEPGSGMVINSRLGRNKTSVGEQESSIKLSLLHNESLKHLREPFFRSVPLVLFFIVPPLLYLLIVVILYLRSGNSTKFFLSLFQREDSYTQLKGKIRGLKSDYSLEKIRDFSEYLIQWIQTEYQLDHTSGLSGLYKTLISRGMAEKSADKLILLFEKMDEYCWSGVDELDVDSTAEFFELLSDLKPDDFYCKSGRKTS